MKFLPALKASLFRLRFVLICSTLGIALAAGGAYGYKVYKHKQSPAFALEQLHKALGTVHMASLAQLIDFRALSLDLAKQIYAARPATPRTGTLDQAIIALADEVQLSLMQAFTAAKNADKPPKIAPLAPLAPWPHDLVPQLGSKLAMQTEQENVVFVRAEVEYERIHTTFPMVLLMEKRDQWRITRIANSQEMVRLFVQAEAELERQREQAFQDKNTEQQGRMDAQFSVSACTAAAYTLSDKKTALLSIQVQGNNKGPHTIHNMTVTATLKGKNMQAKRNINFAVRLGPGENLSQGYNMDIDNANAEDMALLNAGVLQCEASPRAMTLSSGEVLHLRVK